MASQTDKKLNQLNQIKESKNYLKQVLNLCWLKIKSCSYLELDNFELIVQ